METTNKLGTWYNLIIIPHWRSVSMIDKIWNVLSTTSYVDHSHPNEESIKTAVKADTIS